MAGEYLVKIRIEEDGLVRNYLEEHPDATIEEMAYELGKKPETIRNSLYRIKDEGPDPLLENAQYFCRKPKIHKWTDPRTGKRWDDISEFFGIFGGYDL